MHLYCSFALDCDEVCVGLLGGCEAGALALVEPTLKYQPDVIAVLTWSMIWIGDRAW